MGNIAVFPEPVGKIPLPHLRADERALLAAHIVAHHEHVHFLSACLEDFRVVVYEIVDDVVANALNDFGVRGEVNEGLLNASHIHHRFELSRSVQPVALVEYEILRVPFGAILLHLGIIPPVGCGPTGIGIDFLHGLHMFQRRPGHFLECPLVRSSLPIGNDLSPYPPKVLHRPVVIFLEFLTHVAGPVVIPDIHTQELQQFFLVLTSPVLHAPLLDLRNHPVVDGNTIRFLEVYRLAGPLAGRHFFILCPEFINPISPILVGFVFFHVLPPFQ